MSILGTVTGTVKAFFGGTRAAVRAVPRTTWEFVHSGRSGSKYQIEVTPAAPDREPAREAVAALVHAQTRGRLEAVRDGFATSAAVAAIRKARERLTATEAAINGARAEASAARAAVAALIRQEQDPAPALARAKAATQRADDLAAQTSVLAQLVEEAERNARDELAHLLGQEVDRIKRDCQAERDLIRKRLALAAGTLAMRLGLVDQVRHFALTSGLVDSYCRLPAE